MRNRFWFLAVVFLSLIFVVIFSIKTVFDTTVTLRTEGFQPEKLTIKAGEAVTFKSVTGEQFWPASNVHPLHTIYPEFDPRRPLAPDETWSFTFDSPGVYRYHDHINSQFTGEIVVTANDGEIVTVDCSEDKSPACWEKLMLETLEKQGVEASLNVLVDLTENEPEFSYDCHAYTHLIGEEAYELFENSDDFKLTPATSLCGYGFYHGFMESLLQTTGDVELAREFCAFADEEMEGKIAAASTACYHGTGHGAVDGADPTAWGDVEAMMAPGFAMCDLLVETELQDYLCRTGVYNAVEILSRDSRYGLDEVQADPFAVCNRQALKYREACYSNMLPVVLSLADYDIAVAADYVNEHMQDKEAPAIDGYTVNEMVTIGLFYEYIRTHSESDPNYATNGIKLCQAQPADDRLACIEGLSGGHIKYGRPGVEYEKNLEFCQHPLLAKDEEEVCYAYLLKRLRNRYDLETSRAICDMVPNEYAENYCRFN